MNTVDLIKNSYVYLPKLEQETIREILVREVPTLGGFEWRLGIYAEGDWIWASYTMTPYEVNRANFDIDFMVLHMLCLQMERWLLTR